MLSLAVNRQDFQQNSKAWYHIGFIPNYHLLCKEEEKEKTTEKSLALFHELLVVLLDDLSKLQKNHHV
jgi:hypothetical protein